MVQARVILVVCMMSGLGLLVACGSQRERSIAQAPVADDPAPEDAGSGSAESTDSEPQRIAQALSFSGEAATPLTGPFADPSLGHSARLLGRDDCNQCAEDYLDLEADASPFEAVRLAEFTPEKGGGRLCTIALRTKGGWFLDRARASSCDDAQKTRWLLRGVQVMKAAPTGSPRVVIDYSEVRDKSAGQGRADEARAFCGVGASGHPSCVHLYTGVVEVDYGVHLVDGLALNEIRPTWRIDAELLEGDTLELRAQEGIPSPPGFVSVRSVQLTFP